MPAPIPTDEAVRTANAVLSFIRERPGRIVHADNGAKLLEFQWPGMEPELREAEPRTSTVLGWLVATEHLIYHERASGRKRGNARFAVYRVSLDRAFTAADLARARKVRSKAEQTRQARKSPLPSASAAVPPPPQPEAHTHTKQWDDERVLRYDTETPPRTGPSLIDKHEGCERALHAQAMDYEQRLTDQARDYEKATRDLRDRLADSEALVRALLDDPKTADLIRRAMRVAREAPA